MQQKVFMRTTSVIAIMPATCLLHYLLCTMHHNDLYCPITKATATAGVAYFNFNNLKYFVSKIYIFIQFVFTSCNFHSAESRITELVINKTTNTTYRKVVFC
jgi:hypothetical protein